LSRAGRRNRRNRRNCRRRRIRTTSPPTQSQPLTPDNTATNVIALVADFIDIIVVVMLL